MYGLKLIWRLLTGDSLWGKWIKRNIFKGKNFWEVNHKMQSGSWMWRKLLKLREVAKSFYKKEIGNGRHISFWFDVWSAKGNLFEILGPRGIIDLGVGREETLEGAVLNTRRRRRHRLEILNDIEEELSTISSKLNPDLADTSLWKRKSGYKQCFSTKETWLMMRDSKPEVTWAKSVWFHNATPKYAFMAWLSVKNKNLLWIELQDGARA